MCDFVVFFIVYCTALLYYSAVICMCFLVKSVVSCVGAKVCTVSELTFAADRPEAEDIDRQLRVPCSRRRRPAANAGSVTLRADGGGSTQSWLVISQDISKTQCVNIHDVPWLTNPIKMSSKSFQLSQTNRTAEKYRSF